jgi:hypothetical protein
MRQEVRFPPFYFDFFLLLFLSLPSTASSFAFDHYLVADIVKDMEQDGGVQSEGRDQAKQRKMLVLCGVSFS